MAKSKLGYHAHDNHIFDLLLVTNAVCENWIVLLCRKLFKKFNQLVIFFAKPYMKQRTSLLKIVQVELLMHNRWMKNIILRIPYKKPKRSYRWATK